MPKISVIIPIYNTAEYLKKCLESIVSQGFQDIEIIIINDGSVDNSEEIIMKFQDKYKENMIKDKKQKVIEIKYYYKENTGVADTRNLGVELAKGKYICFVDSDDYLELDLFSELEQYINKDIDIIKYKMQKVNEKNEIIQKLDGPIFDICTGEEAFRKLNTVDKYIDVPCAYLFKTKYFLENKFMFKKDTQHEDFGLIPLVLVNSKTFVSTNTYGYNYLQTNNSITRSIDYEKIKKRVFDCLIHYDNMLDKIKIFDISNKSKMEVKRFYTNAIVMKAKELKKEDKIKYIKQLKVRKVYKNIIVTNIIQLIKKIMLKLSINMYLNISN